MAISMSSLTSSFSSLSFSSQVSPRTQTLYFPRTKSIQYSPKTQSFTIVACDTTTIAADTAPVEESESDPIVDFLFNRGFQVAGGFAAQTIIGTGRRKSVIARVVLQEGTGQVIINYRDAKVNEIVFMEEQKGSFQGLDYRKSETRPKILKELKREDKQLSIASMDPQTNKTGFPAAILNLFWGVLIWKRKAEEALIASGLPYTIVRPGSARKLII